MADVTNQYVVATKKEGKLVISNRLNTTANRIALHMLKPQVMVTGNSVSICTNEHTQNPIPRTMLSTVLGIVDWDIFRRKYFN